MQLCHEEANGETRFTKLLGFPPTGAWGLLKVSVLFLMMVKLPGSHTYVRVHLQLGC